MPCRPTACRSASRWPRAISRPKGSTSPASSRPPVAQFVWAVKPDSPIKTIKDIKGRKIGYTNPRSTSQALANMLVQSAGLKPEDVELVKTGGFGQGIAGLDSGLIDVAPITEPLWSRGKGKNAA